MNACSLSFSGQWWIFLRSSPNTLFALDVIDWICLPHFKSSLRITPRYLASWTWSKITPARVYNLVNLCSERDIDNITHLEGLKFIPHLRDHSCRDVRSCCRFSWSWMVPTDLYSKQSSANKRTWDVTLSGRSFIYNRKRSGPRTVPCGTPDSTLVEEEVSPSRHTTHWVRFLRKAAIQDHVWPSIP